MCVCVYIKDMLYSPTAFIGITCVHTQDVHMASYNNDPGHLGPIMAEGFTTMLTKLNIASVNLDFLKF